MPEAADNPRDAGASHDAGTAQAVGRQLFAAIAVGVVAFTIVMLLMVLAVAQAPPPVVSDAEFQSTETSLVGYAHHIVVEESISRVITTARGDRELELTGHVKNTGNSAVKAANIRCCFRTASGGEAIFELPLVVDTRVDAVGSGWLMPLSGREFSVRIGRFPERIEPEPSDIEVTNVSIQRL
jgi:hypothetical protein